VTLSSPERSFHLAWAKTVQREHLLLETILAWGRCVAWANYAENNNFYCLRANMHASDDKNNKNQHAYTINGLP